MSNKNSDKVFMETETKGETMDRNDTIKAIRNALRRRSGKNWSVTGGRGTSYGWITVTAPPARMVEGWRMTDEDATELFTLLGFERIQSYQHVSIPNADDYYREYIDRAEGRAPSVIGSPYWD